MWKCDVFKLHHKSHKKMYLLNQPCIENVLGFIFVCSIMGIPSWIWKQNTMQVKIEVAFARWNKNRSNFIEKYTKIIAWECEFFSLYSWETFQFWVYCNRLCPVDSNILASVLRPSLPSPAPGLRPSLPSPAPGLRPSLPSPAPGTGVAPGPQLGEVWQLINNDIFFKLSSCSLVQAKPGQVQTVSLGHRWQSWDVIKVVELIIAYECRVSRAL